MREPYICPYCDHRSTRWWNLKTHIKRRHRLLLDRSTDRYMAGNPLWHTPNNPYHNIGSLTVADRVGDSFQPRRIPQQASPGISQYSSSPMYGPMPTMDDQSYETGLSQGTVGRIKELKGLMNKCPQHHIPDGIIRLAIFNSINGDNQLLDQMLQQLHGIDSLANNKF